MAKVSVRMIKNHRYSDDNVTVKHLDKGQDYEVDATLADALVAEGVAERLPEKAAKGKTVAA